MITYDPDRRIVTLSLVDLEHCGFDHELFEWELHTLGLDKMPGATWPAVLIVNFAGGAVITDDIESETLKSMRSAADSYQAVVDAIWTEAKG